MSLNYESLVIIRQGKCQFSIAPGGSAKVPVIGNAGSDCTGRDAAWRVVGRQPVSGCNCRKLPSPRVVQTHPSCSDVRPSSSRHGHPTRCHVVSNRDSAATAHPCCVYARISTARVERAGKTHEAARRRQMATAKIPVLHPVRKIARNRVNDQRRFLAALCEARAFQTHPDAWEPAYHARSVAWKNTPCDAPDDPMQYRTGVPDVSVRPTYIYSMVVQLESTAARARAGRSPARPAAWRMSRFFAGPAALTIARPKFRSQRTGTA
jgi:hypothetical protein